MLYNNVQNKLTKIRGITNNALSVFNRILNDLEIANDKLSNIIHEESDKVALHNINIYEAESHIKDNLRVINKLKVFLNED